jgi:hypothetical protein
MEAQQEKNLLVDFANTLEQFAKKFRVHAALTLNAKCTEIQRFNAKCF